jgi:hypothetical protein
MHESAAQKIAFSVLHRYYEFKRLAFRLKNAPAIFQQFIDQALSGQGNELFIYCDVLLYMQTLLWITTLNTIN